MRAVLLFVSDVVYTVTLLSLLQLFNATIESSEKSDQLAERLKICLRETTMTIYNNVARYGII